MSVTDVADQVTGRGIVPMTVTMVSVDQAPGGQGHQDANAPIQDQEVVVMTVEDGAAEGQDHAVEVAATGSQVHGPGQDLVADPDLLMWET